MQAAKLEPTNDTVRRIGNMYTASLYGGLASLISNISSNDMQGKRILFYAFGSGCAASVFSAKVVGDVSHIKEKMGLKQRLEAMQVVPCQTYVDALKMREETHNKVDFTPKGDVANVWDGAFYLEKIDKTWRRSYARVGSKQTIAALPQH